VPVRRDVATKQAMMHLDSAVSVGLMGETHVGCPRARTTSTGRGSWSAANLAQNRGVGAHTDLFERFGTCRYHRPRPRLRVSCDGDDQQC